MIQHDLENVWSGSSGFLGKISLAYHTCASTLTQASEGSPDTLPAESPSPDAAAIKALFDWTMGCSKNKT